MKLFIPAIFLTAFVFVSGCRKEDPRPEVVESEPQRDQITYKMTIVPRSIYRPGETFRDSLVVQLNGNTILSKYGLQLSDRYDIKELLKTGDVIRVYYNPGKTYYYGNLMTDENALAIYLDYNISNNILLKEFKCRCIGDYTTTLE